MYLSRIQLQFDALRPAMLEKWQENAAYASHQWLWQLFPEQDKRQFLFRQEQGGGFFVLSSVPPLAQHNLFCIETRPYTPQLASGALLDFQLRANPVVTRGGKRSDVMMDARYQAKRQEIPRERWSALQEAAARRWLEAQGEKHGFELVAQAPDLLFEWAGEEDEQQDLLATATIVAYTQHRLTRTAEDKPIVFSSVDFAGTLRVTDPQAFTSALYCGLGKSKALGCGLLMVKRRR
ncbi:type I-E CRISPR-associated protein Cas6/Cse3/CasE [Pluralibacter gergoviae]|uniref:type I-E CRISPR-associated protein Cas6/Cse3/CasE n=1 Tax=Pluralibacter gergoviae TaxID=61647 RepID=UPI0006521A66|nr:type I-E CRISPR-associated protein Cas6/Cse3/CasE [Pluralibacter gergoviae]EKW9968869.1 type I-E CRISPR-associated protein Cas6/Cse3/CasE [Pluralibacter gergoviae]EKZ9516870.1 type I-E CRISPR-associated protein Cas6/Cse3/CasE [Pluralibacter gergoviae]ELC3019084.1 type I-E CRISPR-associated protein Cas6/Cse3/CasE [Pluralibacter gergoviae]ELC3021938.1 type I-E CRISPR-associated protein Cas6/Cse3/CasE [Pluralibacter gergoviae]ELC3075909.1 type I-E CRISPR-associated protein Cas6/Cse3/CasE [Plur